MRALVLLAILAATELGQPAAYRAELEKIRQHRLEELTAPNGWLAVLLAFQIVVFHTSSAIANERVVTLPARIT